MPKPVTRWGRQTVGMYGMLTIPASDAIASGTVVFLHASIFSVYEPPLDPKVSQTSKSWLTWARLLSQNLPNVDCILPQAWVSNMISFLDDILASIAK